MVTTGRDRFVAFCYPFYAFLCYPDAKIDYEKCEKYRKSRYENVMKGSRALITIVAFPYIPNNPEQRGKS